MAKQDDWPKFTLRLPVELHRRLAEAAGAKSLNAEIVARLSQTLDESYFPISDVGVMALLKRFDAGVSLLEDLMIAHYKRELEQFIEDEAKAGNRMTRPAAVKEIVDRYLFQHGYAPFRGRVDR